MEKSDKSKEKDKLKTGGKVWIKDSRLNYRQSSGLEFGGRYLTAAEARIYDRVMAAREKEKKC